MDLRRWCWNAGRDPLLEYIRIVIKKQELFFIERFSVFSSQRERGRRV